MARVTQQLNLESGAIFKMYTAAGITADVNLSIDYPGWSAANGRNDKLPRYVVFVGGDLVIEDAQDNSTTLDSSLAGIPLPLAPFQITNAGTTATFIVVIW